MKTLVACANHQSWCHACTEYVGCHTRRLDFDAPPNERRMLLEGLDAIGLTLKRKDEIEAFQRADRVARPWIW